MERRLNETTYSNRDNTQARVKRACKERGFNTESVYGVEKFRKIKI